MMKLILGTLVITCCTMAHAGVVSTSWTADTAVDGTGTGTLGSRTVTYTTVNGYGNAGITIGNNWDTSLATAASGPYSSQTAGVLGSLTDFGPTTQTISFSASITNPLLLVNFSDATSTMDFGGLTLSFLTSNNAQLTGNTIDFTGSTNSSDDGFVAQINGTFGPGSDLTFIYGTSASFDSVAFSIAESGRQSAGTPEPATLALTLACLTALVFARRRLSPARP